MVPFMVITFPFVAIGELSQEVVEKMQAKFKKLEKLDKIS